MGPSKRSSGSGGLSSSFDPASGLSLFSEQFGRKFGEWKDMVKQKGEKAMGELSERVLQPFVNIVRRASSVSAAGDEIAPPSSFESNPGDSEALMKEMSQIGLGPPTMAPLPKSDSCPDLFIEDDPNDDEETRKRKRLARNRASAQMRRLRKRTIVRILQDETESLEQRLKSMRAGRNRATLTLLFGDDEGLQGETLSPARKNVAKQFILDRHVASVAKLRSMSACNCAILSAATRGMDADTMVGAPLRSQAHRTHIKAHRAALSKDLAANLEPSKTLPQELIDEAAAVLLDKVGGVGVHTGMSRGLGRAGKGLGSQLEAEILEFGSNEETDYTKEVTSLSAELDDLLQLTPEQKRNIALIAPNIHREQVKLESMSRLLSEVLIHDWLEFPQTDTIRREFNSVLKPEQLAHVDLLNTYYQRLEQMQARQ